MRLQSPATTRKAPWSEGGRTLRRDVAVVILCVSLLSVSCRSTEKRESDRSAGATPFEVEYGDVPAGVPAAFEYAADVWASIVVSDVPIKIRVSFAPLTTRGMCIPNAVKDFDSAPQRSTWYPAALADAISGKDLQQGEYDMEIFFSTRADWYFGSGGKVPPGESDFTFVALHEICHGLGFASLLSLDRGVGSYGKKVFDHAPQVSFEIPDLAGLPSVFDRFVENQSGQRLVDEFPNASVRLGAELSRSRLFFGGANAVRRNGNRRPRLYGRDPSHLDRQSYENDFRDGMMTPGPGQPDLTEVPGPIVMGVLEDLGWELHD